MRRISENLNYYYTLSKFALNGVLGILASYQEWEKLFPVAWLVLFLPIGGVVISFLAFRYLLGLSEDSPLKMFFLQGTFSSWAFFLVFWIIYHAVA